MAADSREKLRALVAERFADRKFVVVANREPLVHQRDAKGVVHVLHPASGMSTALAPIVEACSGVWVAHGSGSADFDVVDERSGIPWPEGDHPTSRLRRVRLSPEIERGYYYGLSNEGLWPLCHIAYTAPQFQHRHWEAYRTANRAFADAVLDEIGSDPAVVFVQDYHLGLVPRMLRKARPDILIAHFWHIPWPNREVMRVFPWTDEFLNGMLGSDLVGFHVQLHCNNFLDTIDRGIESLVDYEYRRAIRDGHPTFVRSFPISIDVDSYASLAKVPLEKVYPELAAETRGKLLLLGVDRLDYTKGIPQRIRIYESLLEKRPDLHGRAMFVQVGAPSRSAIGRYAALAREVQQLVDEVNHRFAREGWLPIRYIPEHNDRDKLAPLYRRADACLVTPLHDGMNLVAKEYVAAHAGEPGTLLLSKFTGASRELLEACLVNPYDVETSAEMLAQSLDLDAPLRAEAMSRLYQRVKANDVYDWAFNVLRSLDDIARRHEAEFFPGN